jgi:hypothetical protein
MWVNPLVQAAHAAHLPVFPPVFPPLLKVPSDSLVFSSEKMEFRGFTLWIPLFI